MLRKGTWKKVASLKLLEATASFFSACKLTKSDPQNWSKQTNNSRWLEGIPADLKVRKHLHMAIDLAPQLGSLRLAMDLLMATLDIPGSTNWWVNLRKLPSPGTVLRTSWLADVAESSKHFWVVSSHLLRAWSGAKRSCGAVSALISGWVLGVAVGSPTHRSPCQHYPFWSRFGRCSGSSSTPRISHFQRAGCSTSLKESLWGSMSFCHTTRCWMSSARNHLTHFCISGTFAKSFPKKKRWQLLKQKNLV